MNLKNYRITPLGYVIMMAILLCCTILISHILRPMNDSGDLVYKISQSLKSEAQFYGLSFKMNTIGDAVIYKQKSIESENNLSIQPNYIYINGHTNNIKYDAFLTPEHLIAKPNGEEHYLQTDINKLISLWNEKYFFKLSDIYDILKSTEDEKALFLAYDLPKIAGILDAYGTMDEDAFTMEITFVELFDLADNIIHQLSENKEMVKIVQGKYTRFYDLFAHNPLLKDNTLNSRRLFTTLVALNDDFYGTCHNYINRLKKQYTNVYHENSTIVIKLYFDKKTIHNIECYAQLRYNSCDAYEEIYIAIDSSEPTDISLPEGQLNSLDDYIRKTLQSVHLSIK